jgi:hypothetical protein
MFAIIAIVFFFITLDVLECTVSIVNPVRQHTLKNKGTIFLSVGDILLSGDRYIIALDHDYRTLHNALDLLETEILNFEIKQTDTNDETNKGEIKFILNELVMIRSQIKDIERSIYPVLKKRGLGELGGQVLRTAFDVALISDVKRVYDAIEGLSQTQDSIIQVQKELAIYVNDTRALTTQTAYEILKISNDVMRISQTLQFSTNVNKMYRRLQACQNLLTNIKEAWLTASIGKLSPFFLPHDVLYDALQVIQQSLPPELFLIKPLNKRNLYVYYTVSKVAILVKNNAARIFVEIPLRSYDRLFQLYKVIPMPYFIRGTTLAAYVLSKQNYLAITSNLRQYFTITKDELQSCQSAVHDICQPMFPIYKAGEPNCLFALFTGNDVMASETCDIRLTLYASSSFYRPKGSNVWFYSVREDMKTVTRCPGKRPEENLNSVILLHGTGYVEIPRHCYLTGNNFELYPHNSMDTPLNISLTGYNAVHNIIKLINSSSAEITQDKGVTNQIIDIIKRLETPAPSSERPEGVSIDAIMSEIKKSEERKMEVNRTIRENKEGLEVTIFNLISVGFYGIILLILLYTLLRTYRHLCNCIKCK